MSTTLEQRVDELEQAVGALALELGARCDRGLAELRDDMHDELVAIGRRIDEVHARALRELTRLHERRQAR